MNRQQTGKGLPFADSNAGHHTIFRNPPGPRPENCGNGMKCSGKLAYSDAVVIVNKEFQQERDNGMGRIQTEMVAMRDGIKLFTTIHFPEGDGPFPVILVRNLYRGRGMLAAGQPVTEQGIALVEQDVRGSGRSEGRWEKPWIQEIDDGEDCLKWLSSQPWCSGRIAMRGGSYLGAAQWFAARSGRKELVAVAPGIAPCNYHESPKYQGGAFILQQNISWALGTWQRNAVPEAEQKPFDAEALSRHLPLREIDEAAGLGVVPFWQEWQDHPCYDEYWRKFDLASFVERIQAPAFIWSGWFDIYTQGALDSFLLMRNSAGSPEARKLTRCVIGPWTHGEEIGDLPRGEDCSREKHVDRPVEEFLISQLKQEDAAPFAPLRYFLLGVNEWRSAESWPPAGVRERNFYLHSGGAANSRHGDGALSEELPGEELPDCFISDPHNPVPTTGGHGICLINGSRDQSELELRSDILVYTTAALTAPLTIAGRVLVFLHASSTAPDTDFTAKLVDVYPDGRAFNLANGILRARCRNSMEKPELLQPGEIYEFRIDLWSIANCFLPGHRIRLEIAGSDFPEFSRNSQTGGSIAEDTELRIARQTVFHDRTRLSRLLLPVLEE